jgi:hypothetical protein
MGTGQGKSVVLAMLALRLAQENQRVVIYTCYQHLAQRDYDGFKDLYTNFGDAQDRALSARLQSDDRHKGLVQGDVVYANINTHFLKFNRYLEERSTNQHENPGVSAFYCPEAVLLDEFDSLIIDSKGVGRAVIDFNQSLFSFGSISKDTVRSQSELARYIAENSDVGDFFSRLVSLGLDALYQRWHAGEAMDFKAPTTGLSKLGKESSYIGGMGHELTHGRFYGYAATIDPLVYF